MIGLIMAAGKGSRLENLTEDTPKSLLELSKGFTLLDYNLKVLEQAGIKKILVVVGFEYEKIEAKVKEYSNLDITTIYNPFWDCCNVLGSLYTAFPYLEDDFLFLHADTLVDESIWKQLIKSDEKMVLPYQRKKCGEEEMKVVLDSDGNIKRITKEIDPQIVDGEFLGIAKFAKDSIGFLEQTAKELFSKEGLNLYMEAAIEVAIKKGLTVSSFDIGSAKFVEVDFKADLDIAREKFGVS